MKKLRQFKSRILRPYNKYSNMVKLYLEDILENQLPYPIIEASKIHSITVVPFFTKTYIFISLQRPGIFIGRQGKNINEVKSLLEKGLGHKIEFRLKEYNPFGHKY